ncbi:MAG: signal recognition particle-docking protein FtsY [Deltaproteobacteria bacterium]|nr:signal recognition particle-docking protein FtsY [Deltaproteobacteria bacterium]
MLRPSLLDLAPVAGQAPPPVTAVDLIGFIVLGGLALLFVALAVAFVIKSRRKRLAELTEALEAKPGDEELAAEAEAAAELPEAAAELPPPQDKAVRREDEQKAAEKAEAEKRAAEKREAEQKAAEKAEVEKRAAEKREAEQKAAEKAEAEKRAAEKREAEQKAAEKAEAQKKAAAEKAEREKLEKERHEAEKRAAEQQKARLRDGLSKTRSGFIGRLTGLFGAKRELDKSLLDDLEQILITSDIGVKTAQHLLELVSNKIDKKEVDQPDKVRAALQAEIERILDLENRPLEVAESKPLVLMVVGVNGGGKTTTIGKLAQRFRDQGRRVVLGAGDTFRAAAADQLEVWAQRSGADLVRGKEGQDPSSVLFEAVKRAQSSGADVVIADTAGRLHTKVNLMEELKKVYRVLGKAALGAPHEVLLVLDATTGQNAIAQAAQFNAAIPLTGIVLTKLDGTAKGGVIVGICQEFKIPVRFIGIGEKLDDLRQFDAREFGSALFDEG